MMQLSHFPLFFLLASHAVAVTISPSSTAPPDQADQLGIKWGPNTGTSMTFDIQPLTSGAGLGATKNTLGAYETQGLLVIPTDSGNSTTAQQVAYLTCDNDNSSNLSPSDVFTNAASHMPKAIVLYSLAQNSCSLGDPPTFSSIFTMVNMKSSQTLFDQLNSTSAPLAQARIATLTNLGSINGSATDDSSPSASSSASPNQSEQTGGTPAPTTAVAMSILYSITGIITLLFLIIIATGAVRAHRHPERYGPRNGGFPGRPRQSRAKGLARAMLETLPIVKFGDPEPEKPSRDIELASANSNTANHEGVLAAGENAEVTRPDGANEQEGGLGPNTTTAAAAQESSGSEDDHLGCSICTEDFTRGEDVRVLPCNHKYHPACIDPWLLNVSGTCPLCRVDLRPVQSNASDELPRAEDFGDPAVIAEASEADTAGLGHSTGPSLARRRMSRLLDFNRLRHAEPAERIAALRRYRTQDREEREVNADRETTNGSTTGPDDSRRRSRFGRTIRAAFDVRNGHSEPANAPPPIAGTAGDTSMVGGRGA